MIMFAIFWLTFNVIGSFLSDLLTMGIDAFTAMCDRALTAYGMNPVVHSLLIDGVFAGVGSVLSFLPIIVVLFFFLSILEDSGYMARVAFVMDKPLRKIGLSGRSFVPMLIGFGCTVPAVMGKRSTCNDPSLCCRNHSWNYFGACAEPYGISWKSDPVCDGTSELPFSFRKECIPVDVG